MFYYLTSLFPRKLLEYNYQKARSSSKSISSICCWKSNILSLNLFSSYAKTRMCTKFLLLLSLVTSFQLPLFFSVLFISANQFSYNPCQPNGNDNLHSGESNFLELSQELLGSDLFPCPS